MGGSAMTTTSEIETVPTPEDAGEPTPGRWHRFLRRWHYSFVGLVGAVMFFCLSLTPSLLPRGHILQGLISGITAATGYGLGVLTVWLIGKFSRRPLREVRPVAWRWLGIVAAAAIVLFLILGSNWQREVHQLMGMDPPSQLVFP